MKPLGRKVVIKPDEREEQTTAGIIVVQVTTSKYAQGTVVSVGKDVTEVKVGEKVLYSPALFDEVKHESDEFHIVDELDIFAVV